MKIIYLLLLAVSIFSCSSVESLRQGDGITFAAKETDFSKIWTAANDVMKTEPFNIVVSDEFSGTLKAEHQTNLFKYGEVIGIYITALDTANKNYKVEVVAKDNFKGQINGTNWSVQIANKIKQKLQIK